MRGHATLFSIVALVCVGCPQDPAETVTLHFSGDTTTTEHVLERIIPQLLDSDRMTTVTFQHAADSRGTYATVSPVYDVERFASRCWFGTITKREQRELWISVDPAHTHATIGYYWAVDGTTKLLLWQAFIRSLIQIAFVKEAFIIFDTQVPLNGDNHADAREWPIESKSSR